jgi:diacylglycerol kinase (ATP)
MCCRDRGGVAAGPDAYPCRVRVCIIDNPHSFRGPFPMHRVLPILATAGWRVDLVHREPGRSVLRHVDDALDRGCEIVVGAGGDGTLRDIASALAGRAASLGVLPGGTANVWAHELGVAGSPELAARGLIGATERRMDLGRLALADRRSARFLLMAGIGFDGVILARTPPRLKRILGPVGIAMGALRAAPELRPFVACVTVDGTVAWSGASPQVIVGNTRRYANLVQAMPQARCDDGLLDVTIVPAGCLRSFAPAVRSVMGHGWPLRGLPRMRGRTIEIVTDRPTGIELDGSPVSRGAIERAGRGPVRVSVEPGALRVRVPAGYRGGLFGPGSPIVPAP